MGSMTTQHTSGEVAVAFMLVIFAGLSTALGSAFVFCSSSANTRVLARALGASAGVMIYVSFCEIYGVKAVDAFTEVCDGDSACGWRYASICFFSGLVFMYGLDIAVHKLNAGSCFKGMRRGSSGEDSVSDSARARSAHRPSPSFLSIHGELDGCVRDIAEMERGPSCDDVEAGTSGGAVKSDDPNELDVNVGDVDLSDVHHKAIEPKQLKNMGIMTAVAIGLHNFPEGLATFVAALADPKLGVALAVAIAIHNIPEGICVAMPIYYATGSKWKGFWWSFLSGLSEPLGAIVGYGVLKGNGMSPAAFGALFGLVAGMMVFISVKELIPTALKYDPRDEYVTTFVFVGMFVMAVSLVLFYI